MHSVHKNRSRLASYAYTKVEKCVIKFVFPQYFGY